MTFVINGTNGGNNTIFGNTSGDDILNGFDFNNIFWSGGANDQINTGSGGATVNLGAFAGVTDTVNVGGAFNTVNTNGAGQLGSTLTVQGGTGGNVVTLKNSLGFNNVAMQGFDNIITVNSDATNIVMSGAGRGRVNAGIIGDGNTGFKTSVVAAGQHNTVIGGDQNFTINGGQGFDLISVGNGDNTIVESGTKDKITVGTGNNTITDFGGAATIHFVGTVTDVDIPGVDIPDTTEIVNLGGTNNTVIEDNRLLGSAREFVITGGTGNGLFLLGDGENVLTTSGANNVIQMGSPDQIDGPGGDSVTANGDFNKITLGNGVNVVTANGNSDAITLGNGNNTVTANGADDVITAGNGANKVTANGHADTIKLGNGANNLTANGAEDLINLGNGANTLQANGNADVITIGNGNNSVTAGGNGDTITLGTGNNTVSATGNNDTITSAGGKGAFILGGTDSLTLTGSLVGTTVAANGADDAIVLKSGANVTIADSPFGGGLNLEIDATAGGFTGKVVVNGWGSDPTGVIHLVGFAASLGSMLSPPVAGSDGAGGVLIKFAGGGSLDLTFVSTIDPSQFTTAAI